MCIAAVVWLKVRCLVAVLWDMSWLWYAVVLACAVQKFMVNNLAGCAAVKAQQ
jgi:hypothetical protein